MHDFHIPVTGRREKYGVPLDLKSTLNLPKTDFSMKANLPKNEPKMLAHWEESRLYDRIREAHQGQPIYVMHDGPPYANGPIHLGTALNKTLKDFVVKSRSMSGFDAPYVPGWDCHGLPIEIKVDDLLGRKKLDMDPLAVREECRKYAQKYLDLQRSQFKRLGDSRALGAALLHHGSAITRAWSCRPFTPATSRGWSTRA